MNGSVPRIQLLAGDFPQSCQEARLEINATHGKMKTEITQKGCI